MNRELETKTERLVTVLGAEGLDGVLLNAQHNFSWLTCGGSNGIDLSRENGAGFLFVTRDGRRYVIANNIEIHRLLAEELPEHAAFEPVTITWQGERDPQTLLRAVQSIASGDRFGCDIGFPETRWIEPSIASCRFELTVEEIERFKELGRDAGIAVEMAALSLEPGLTEHGIARTVRDKLAAFGIFPVVTLIGADHRIANFRHPLPTMNVWKSSLLIVVCARRNGLIANLSRIICVGAVPSDLQRRTEAAAFVNASLYSGTTEGTTGAELYEIAKRSYAEAGFADEIDKHHQGGACGYRPRDWVAHPESSDVVRMFQAFAWNPSITGTKTEETGILTPNGFELITATDGFPKLSTVVDGHEYFSPGILSLSKGASA